MKNPLNPESRLQQLIQPLNNVLIRALQEKMNECQLLSTTEPLIADGVFGRKSRARFNQLAPLFGLITNEISLPILLDLLVMSHPFATKIKQNHLSPDQYYPSQPTAKKGVLLHHTVSGPNPNDVRDFFERKPERVGTHFCIGGDSLAGDKDWDGVIIQLFPLLNWAHHINTYSFNETHNKAIIGVEICRWGMLRKEYNSYSTRSEKPQLVPDYQVEKLDKNFNGGQYFHKYTIAQARVTLELLCYLRDIFHFDYSGVNWDTFFKLDEAMVANKKTVSLTAHTTWRKPNKKSDIYPAARMRVVLEAVATYTNVEAALAFFDQNVT